MDPRRPSLRDRFEPNVDHGVSAGIDRVDAGLERLDEAVGISHGFGVGVDDVRGRGEVGLLLERRTGNAGVRGGTVGVFGERRRLDCVPAAVVVDHGQRRRLGRRGQPVPGGRYGEEVRAVTDQRDDPVVGPPERRSDRSAAGPAESRAALLVVASGFGELEVVGDVAGQVSDGTRDGEDVGGSRLLSASRCPNSRPLHRSVQRLIQRESLLSHEANNLFGGGGRRTP